MRHLKKMVLRLLEVSSLDVRIYRLRRWVNSLASRSNVDWVVRWRTMWLQVALIGLIRNLWHVEHAYWSSLVADKQAL